MGKKLMLALALVALVAAPAFASVQNVKVGGDLKTTSIMRNGFDLGSNTTASENNRAQSVILSQVNLNIEADLTDNVSTKLGLKNERLWGGNAASTATSDTSKGVTLETAYVTMKELLYSPLTVSVGRQPLSYGNELVIGAAGRQNALTEVTDLTGDANFDAIKAVLSYDPLTVDLFASRIEENKLNSSNDNTNVNLYGVNANYKFGDKMSTVVEGYTFVKKTNFDDGVLRQTKNDTLYVPGLRVSTNPIEGLNVQLEGAYQTGTNGTGTAAQGKSKVSAYALQGKVNYALPVMKDMNPVLGAGYTYLSGDPESAADGKTRQWTQVYGNQFVGTIWNTLFTQQNLAVANVSFEFVPVKDLTAKLSWYGVSLAQRVGSLTLNRPDGATATTAITMSGKGKKLLGNEVDLDLTYAYTEDVKFGVSAGYFAPGKGLSPAAQDAATQLLSSVSVSF